MKVVTWDIETTPLVVYTWGLYGIDSISPDNIIQDRSIICIAWKELGKAAVGGACVGEMTEREVVTAFRNYVDDADVLVAHNGDKFDVKHLNAKLIQYELPPMPHINTVDTLKEVRKIAKFSSNRLDYLVKKLIGGGKQETNFALWKACMVGDESALRKMFRYCKHDVKILEQLYVKLRPYFRGTVNMADVGTLNCPRCNSADIKMRKEYRTKAGIVRNHFNCNDCRAPFTMRSAHKSPGR